jgi:hypothetical protein
VKLFLTLLHIATGIKASAGSHNIISTFPVVLLTERVSYNDDDNNKNTNNNNNNTGFINNSKLAL